MPLSLISLILIATALLLFVSASHKRQMSAQRYTIIYSGDFDSSKPITKRQVLDALSKTASSQRAA